jgi:hypothetical protein
MKLALTDKNIIPNLHRVVMHLTATNPAGGLDNAAR